MVLSASTTPLFAEMQPDGTDPDPWQQTRDSADAWWERSRDAAEGLWKDTLQTTDEILEDTRDLWVDQHADSFTRIWNELLPTLEQTLELTERHDELPKDAWLGADQTSNQDEIEELLDESVAILSTSDLQDVRGRIKSLQQAIEKVQQEIAGLRQQRVVAPDDAVWKKTADEYSDAIAERIADIEHNRRELTKIKAGFAQGLRDIGLTLSDEQVSLLLSTVIGDNVVDLAVVFDNVKIITVQLEQLVNGGGEDLDSARRYYGMYVILLRALDRMHVHVEQAINDLYIAQIDTISEQAKALMVETKRLRLQSPEKRDLFDANLRAQQLTIEAAAVYRRYLMEQSRQVAKARSELDKDIAAAWNTYETVRVSGEFVALVKSSRRLLDGLLNRQVPTLRPFQNVQMKREFDKLTEQLRIQQGT